jgi:hypothetical protein
MSDACWNQAIQLVNMHDMDLVGKEQQTMVLFQLLNQM